VQSENYLEDSLRDVSKEQLMKRKLFLNPGLRISEGETSHKMWS